MNSENTDTAAPSAVADHRRTSPTKDLVDTLAAAGKFATLLTAIRLAGLTETLRGRGPHTLFAPTDAAFEKIVPRALDALRKDSNKLKAILSYHVIVGYKEAKDLSAREIMTLQGTPLTASASESGALVNGIPLVDPDLAATNGLVHGIDSLILPKNWQLLRTAA